MQVEKLETGGLQGWRRVLNVKGQCLYSKIADRLSQTMKKKSLEFKNKAKKEQILGSNPCNIICLLSAEKKLFLKFFFMISFFFFQKINLHP